MTYSKMSFFSHVELTKGPRLLMFCCSLRFFFLDTKRICGFEWLLNNLASGLSCSCIRQNSAPAQDFIGATWGFSHVFVGGLDPPCSGLQVFPKCKHSPSDSGVSCRSDLCNSDDYAGLFLKKKASVCFVFFSSVVSQPYSSPELSCQIQLRLKCAVLQL